MLQSNQAKLFKCSRNKLFSDRYTYLRIQISFRIYFFKILNHIYLDFYIGISEEQVCEVEIQIQNEEKCEIVDDQECDTVNERQCSVTEVEQCQEQLQLITEELCEDIIETTCTLNNECSVRYLLFSSHIPL